MLRLEADEASYHDGEADVIAEPDEQARKSGALAEPEYPVELFPERLTHQPSRCGRPPAELPPGAGERPVPPSEVSGGDRWGVRRLELRDVLELASQRSQLLAQHRAGPVV